MKHSIIPQNVCPRKMDFELEGEQVRNIKLHGGCPGNSKALSILLEGKEINEICNMLEGVVCGNRGTSCSDQLCKAIKHAHSLEKKS